MIAEWLLRKLLLDRGMNGISVRSGGIAPFARDGSLVSLEARLVLREEGVELTEETVSTDLKRHPELVESADLILAMTEEQKAAIARLPEAEGKRIATFREFAGDSGDIADPFSQGDLVYQQCKDEIKLCAHRIVERLAKLSGSSPTRAGGSPPGEGAPGASRLAGGGLSRWERLRSSTVYQCRLFSVKEARGRFGRDQSEHDIYLLELQDWVNIIPLTRDLQVVMVRQYRHGIDGFTLEIPGGLIDPGDQTPIIAARREMVEESGYDSERIESLGFVHPNPAIQSNRCYSFVARNVVRIAAPQSGSTEETEVELVALSEIPELVRKGSITHALVLAAFQCLAAKSASFTQLF